MHPKVTVAIIAYYAQFLEECVRSVLDQTYKDMKVIVYDDYSPENLGEIVSKFDDPRLQYVRNKENLGATGNHNQALDLCDTEYINVFHGDDKMFPWMIEREVEILDANPDVSLVASSTTYPMREDGAIHSSRGKNDVKKFKRFEATKEICRKGDNIASSPSMMFRAQKLDEIGLRARPELGLTADFNLFLEADLSEEFGSIVLLGDPLLAYRSHDKSNRQTMMKNSIFPAESFKNCEELIARSGLSLDLTALHAGFVTTALRGYAKAFMEGNLSMADIENTRESLWEKFQWRISDAEYRNFLTVDALGSDVVRIGHGVSYWDVLKKARLLKARKFPVSNIRLLKWFVKYCLMGKFFSPACFLP